MKQVSISKFGILMRKLEDEDFPLEVTRDSKVVFYVFKEIPGADLYKPDEQGYEVPLPSPQPEVESIPASQTLVCQFSTGCNASSIGEFVMSYKDDFGNPISKKMYLCFGHSQLQVSGVTITKA